MKYAKYIFTIFFIIFLYRVHLPTQLPAQDILTTGYIGSLSASYSNRVEFLFIPEKFPHTKIWLAWYRPPPVTLHVGDLWELRIRIRPTQKYWLLAQHINAAGTVQFDMKNQLLEKYPLRYPVQHLREKIYTRLKSTLSSSSYSQSLGFISALTIGMRDSITETQWQDLRGTGTNHLMAIAGLHIGFVSGIAYFLINFLWRRSAFLILLKPAQEAASIAALIAAFLYALLSGFALPAERALIMLSVFLISYLYRKKISVWTSYCFAISIILMLDPLSLMTPTFWLSFTAVGLLLYTSMGRVRKSTFWDHAIRTQGVMALGLVPLSFLFFHQVSLTGFIANCIAVPFVGLIILPLCLLGIFFNFFWKIAGFLLMHFWRVIHWLSVLPHSQWYGEIKSVNVICFFISIFILLAPRGFPARWMGLWGFVPLLWGLIPQFL